MNVSLLKNFIMCVSDKIEHKGLFVPDVGREQTQSGHEFVSVRNYYLFHFVLKGKGKYYVNENTYSLSKNYGFIIEPGVKTRYVADIYEPWEYCWIGVRGIDVINFLETAELYNKHYFSFETESIEPLLSLLEEIKSNPEINTDYVSLRVNAAFLEIMSCFVPKIKHVSKNLTGVNSIAIDGANFFQKHFAQNIGVNEAATALNVSRVYFSTIFTKEIGKSPKEYLTEIRLDAAKKLLCESNLTLKAIASKCGFTDVSVFSKCFKKVLGVSPNCYNKSIT